MSIGATVHLVDDDESYLRAVTRMLAADGFSVRAFDSPSSLLTGVTPESRGCVVADLSMPGMNGLELQEALAKAGVRMPVVFLSGQGDIPSTVRAMQSGAVDFIEKQAPRQQLAGAILRALRQDATEHEVRERRDGVRRQFDRLTGRELQVLREVVRGQMNKQIAATLGISERTVKLHRTSIKSKVGVRSAARLATLAREAGIFDEPPPAGGH